MPDRKLRSNFTPGTTPWAMRRAQWSALGLSDEDLEKPKIAIVNSSSQLASCFSHLDEIVAPLKSAIRRPAASRSRCAPPRRPTRSPPRGRPGSTSCPRRDLIASDIEVAVEGALLDGMVCLASCDKTTPGQLMAAGRLNIPTIIVACGYQPSGLYRGEPVDFEDIFRFAGHVDAGRMTVSELGEMSRARSPGRASAPGWAPPTPCTWPPRRSAWRCRAPRRCWPSATEDVGRGARRRARGSSTLVIEGVRPRSILTPAAFANAVTAILAVAGR